jgi:hypothetical protein
MSSKKMPREDWLYGMSYDDYETTTPVPPTYTAGKVVRTYIDDMSILLEKLQKEQTSLSLQPAARCRIQIVLCRIQDELQQLESASRYADASHPPVD